MYSASISLNFVQIIQSTVLTKLGYLLSVTKDVSDNDGNKCPNFLCNEIMMETNVEYCGSSYPTTNLHNACIDRECMSTNKMNAACNF